VSRFLLEVIYIRTLKGAAMGIIKTLFMGRDDPNRISLENVFPVGNLTFSMPFEAEQGKRHRIVIEGSPDYLGYFDDHASLLLESEPDPLGRWAALTNYVLEPSLELIYEPRCNEHFRAFRLLVCVLRVDLIVQCDLRLAPIARITATRGYVQCVDLPVPLPEGVCNGHTDLAPTIVLPTPILLIN